MADLEAVAERLNRALDRIERGLATRAETPRGEAADPTEVKRLKQQVDDLTQRREALGREHASLQAAHRALEERCQSLERASADASSRLAGAIAGIDRLLRPQRKGSATQ